MTFRDVQASYVPARHSGESIETLRRDEDRPHVPQTPEYYEWWYFDGHFDGGYSAVIVFHRAVAFVPSRPPALEITLIAPDGAEHRAIQPLSASEFQIASDRADITIGQSGVLDGGNRYEVRARAVTAEGLPIGTDLVLEGILPGWKFGLSKTVVDGLDGFGWVVPLPRARCHGTLHVGEQAIPVSGVGYHDHNWGQVSLSRLVAYWHWGRIYAGEVTCLYADVVGLQRRPDIPSGLLMLALGDKIIFNTSLIRIEEGDLAYHPKAHRTYARRLSLHSEMDGSPVEISLESRQVTSAFDFLASVHPIRRWLVNTFVTRPAYLRHRSDVRLRFTYQDRAYDLTGETINEDMYLRRR
jgi:hypothetical protein